MAIFKLEDENVFINTLESYPEFNFLITSGTVFIDQRPNLSGSAHGIYQQGEVGNWPIYHTYHPQRGNTGWISLYEYNINRPSGSVIYGINETSSSHSDTLNDPHAHPQINSTRISETDPTGSMIRPFVVKDGVRNNLKVNLKSQYNTLFDFGDIVEGDYNLSASITRYHYPYNIANDRPSRITVGRKDLALTDEITYEVAYSLKNAMERYRYKSPHMVFSSQAPIPERDFYTAETNVIVVPSIFYGQKIKKRTVELNYYVTGSLIATLKDIKGNGELVQTYSTSSSPVDYSGSTAGIVLYNEGIFILTGSYQLGVDDSYSLPGSGGGINKWMHFGAGLHKNVVAFPAIKNVAFEIKYQGITQKQTLMMMCNADYGKLNWSNNPTYLSSSSDVNNYSISPGSFKQHQQTIHNTAHTELKQYEPEFKRETYISKVAIYDDKRNLIGVASLANPVRKTEDRQYTFKLKLDL
tara:strand:- start:261 stop:1667 length:1407 start_codon:yes stop_codon:yes gene_type:complete